MKHLYLIVPIAGVILLNFALGKIRSAGKANVKNEETKKLRKTVTIIGFTAAAVAALVWIGIWVMMASEF